MTPSPFTARVQIPQTLSTTSLAHTAGTHEMALGGRSMKRATWTYQDTPDVDDRLICDQAPARFEYGMGGEFWISFELSRET